MSVSNDVDCAFKMLEYMRSGARVNSRVPVTLQWREAGEGHAVGGFTVDISPRGCLAVVPQGFAVGQHLSVSNPMNGRTCEATLIWRGHEGRAGWELGIELLNPPADFWGVEF